MGTTQWRVQGMYMVGNMQYTVNSARYIYDTKWALNSEKCKVHLQEEMSTKQGTVKVPFMLRIEQYTDSSVRQI